MRVRVICSALYLNRHDFVFSAFQALDHHDIRITGKLYFDFTSKRIFYRDGGIRTRDYVIVNQFLDQRESSLRCDFPKLGISSTTKLGTKSKYLQFMSDSF